MKKYLFINFSLLMVLFCSFSLVQAASISCNPVSPTINIKTITNLQPNKEVRTFSSQIKDKNRVTQAAYLYGAAIVKVEVSGLSNLCSFLTLGAISPSCSINIKETKANQLFSDKTVYLKGPKTLTFNFQPKSLLSNLVLDIKCGQASGKYSIGTTLCERPFNQIVKDLNDNKHILITENSFKDWAKDDGFDHCAYNGKKCTKSYPYPTGSGYGPMNWFNSGDEGDIKRMLNVPYATTSPDEADHNTLPSSINTGELKKFVAGLKVPGFLSLIQGGVGLPYLYPNIILNYDEKIGLNSGSPEQVSIRFLDTDNLQFETVNCELKEKEGSLAVFGLAWWCKIEGKSVSINADVYKLYYDEYKSFCDNQANKTSRFCLERAAGLTRWIEDNYPPYLSYDVSPLEVYDFIMAVAHLGEFGYECPRVGAGSASTLKQLQLANIQDSINQIIEQIKKLKVN